jgi:ATP-dependent Clp protease ATP-binding subunit ClpA
VNFKNTIIIMASNLGNEIIKKYSIGFSGNASEAEADKTSSEEMKDKIDKILKDHFKLEFLNRIDEIVLFKSLSKDALGDIVNLELEKIETRLNNKNITVKISQKVKKMLAEKGYDITFGARPLKRIIQNLILDELAMNIVEGKVKDGDKITIDLGEKEKIAISVKA